MKQAKKNWLIFTPGSLQYCSQNYCTVVPEMTVFLFAEITAFLFPVYNGQLAAPFPCRYPVFPFVALVHPEDQNRLPRKKGEGHPGIAIL